MHKLAHAYAITLALISLTSYTMPVEAKPAAIAVNSDRLELRLVEPPLPPSGTPVGRRRGAAGRSGNCTIHSPLTALVPAIEKPVGEGKATYVWGITSAEYPTFWFYVPDSGPSLRSVEFVLQDDQHNDIYRTFVKLPQKQGIVSLSLPSTSTPLKMNQNYHWFLKTEMAVSCQQQEPVIVKDAVEGWVQRVQPDKNLTSQLKAATQRQQMALYAQNGFWYDALTTLAQLRLQKPEDAALKANWQELLQSVGLSEIASQSLVQCCTPRREQGERS
jgi:hypothetical protein